MPIRRFRYSVDAYRLLNGVFCIYKPPKKSFKSSRSTLKDRICNELNAMEVRPPRNYVEISGQLSSGQSLTVETKESFADNPLVVGQRYQQQDIRLTLANNPGWFGSGVIVCFVGRSAHKVFDFVDAQHLRVYEMKGRFGFGTTDKTSEGKIIEKSTFKHVTEGRIGSVISRMQSKFQIQMYKYMGVDIKSEEAYQMASKGLIKPAIRKSQPMIYAIRLTDVSLPDFTVEIDCINEFPEALYDIIHGIGLRLETNAFCTALRLKQLGPFTTDHSLLYKHWSAEHIIQNIRTCRPLIRPELFRPVTQMLSGESELTDHDIFLDKLKSDAQME